MPSKTTTDPAPTNTVPLRLATHVSLASTDLERARRFYEALLGEEPVLVRPDYVRFGPGALGLVLGLNARRSAPRETGALQHLGVLFPDAAALGAARERLAQAGFASAGAEHVECCYAELDQFWVTDPSGVRWELFLAHREVLETPTAAARSSSCCAPSCCA
jgi:catechol 2,3-dioxygenase-like lactoylglutathione lyase family enzyme